MCGWSLGHHTTCSDIAPSTQESTSALMLTRQGHAIMVGVAGGASFKLDSPRPVRVISVSRGRLLGMEGAGAAGTSATRLGALCAWARLAAHAASGT